MGVDEKALGQRLQQARQSAGLTQQQLCQKADLSYSTLAKIERGAIKAPSVFTVATISQVTGVPLEKLLDLDSASPAPPSSKKTSKTGVKFVYFDLNNTLVRSYERAFTQISEQAGLPIDNVEAVFWRYNSGANSGQMTMADFNKTLGDKLGLADFEWQNYYLDVVEAVPGAADLVRWAAEHYQIGLLSGTMPGLIDALRKAGKLPDVQFDQVVDSSEVKLLKDTPDIFKLAEARAGVAADQILLVDDDRLALMLADEQGWQISRFDCYNPEESIARVKTHLEF